MAHEARIFLHDGSNVAIVGGGPAGSFFALHALALARQRGLELGVTIFEPKDFTQPGPLGCNKCAGILSSRLVRNLEGIDLSLPPTVVLSHIRAYVLHRDGVVLEIVQPDPSRQIVSVYRGGGPRAGAADRLAGFDAWLLDEAAARGARVVRERVQAVDLTGPPVVQTQRNHYPCDLVVLASGVNTRPIPVAGTRYVRPVTQTMAQDEVLIHDVETLPEYYGRSGHVHIYFGHPAGMLFAGIVPKGSYANISLLGSDLGKDPVGEFLDAADLRHVLVGESGRLCGCKPQVAVSAAHGIYDDRFVAVGDAAVTRLYKDGINAAFLTARQAAETAVSHGISAESFARHYAPLCRAVDRDNRVGHALFRLWRPTLRNPRLIAMWLDALRAETSLSPDRRRLHLALWGMFTGDDSYQSIARQFLHPEALIHFVAATR